MPRRRRLVLSSDEDMPQQSTTNHQQQNHLEDDDFQSIHSSPPNPNFPEPLQISSSSEDEKFIDVSDHLSPPIHNQSNDLSSNQTSNTESLSSPIGNFLLKMGLGLKSEFIDSCVNGIERSILDVKGKAKVCFEKFLVSDLNCIGNGVLPSNVDSMHLVDLRGPFVLQVDEIVNISCPLNGRYREVSAGIKRCLKLSMTDGVQRVFGIEFRPIKDLQVFAPAGLKVAICNVHIRHGLLMLVPEALEVLGGMVEQLERARQRLVDEVNKPPRGIRSKTRVAPPLATRATLAAWPQNDHSVPENINSSTNVPRHSDTSVNLSRPTNASVLPTATPIPEENRGANMGERGTHASHRISEGFPVPLRAQNTSFISSNGVVSDFEEMRIDPPPVRRESVVSNQQSDYISDHEDVCMVDDFERPIILSRDLEIPFTYLSSLSAKWLSVKEEAPSVQGKVKCFLTGVRYFLYKERTAYELHVYVDDGSLISEILIDHNIIENRIGYSPREVTAALSSSDAKIVAEMKDTMRRFQKFLMNFEGIMLVEMNRTSSLPMALEMNQGCPASDAWLLMRRLKSSSPAQTSHSSSTNLINISP